MHALMRASALLLLPLAASAQTLLPEFEGRGATRAIEDVFDAPGLRAVPGGLAAEFDVPLAANQMLRASLLTFQNEEHNVRPATLVAITAAGDTLRGTGVLLTLDVLTEAPGTVRLVATGVPDSLSKINIRSFRMETLAVRDTRFGPEAVLPPDGTVHRAAAAALTFEARVGEPVLLVAETDAHIEGTAGAYFHDFSLFIFADGAFERGDKPVREVADGAYDGVLWTPEATGRYLMLTTEKGRPDTLTARVAVIGGTDIARVAPDTLVAWGGRRSAARAAAGCPDIAANLLDGTLDGRPTVPPDERRALACPADRERSRIGAVDSRGLRVNDDRWEVLARSDATVTPDVIGRPLAEALRRLGLPDGPATNYATSRTMPYGCLTLGSNVAGDVISATVRHAACPAD